MFYEQKLYVRDDDVTSHETILNFSISLVSCLFRRSRVPNYSNMSHETRGSVLADDVTSHVTILKVLCSLVSCLFRKQRVPNYYSMSYETKGVCCSMTSPVILKLGISPKSCLVLKVMLAKLF